MRVGTDRSTQGALLNCYVREVAPPETVRVRPLLNDAGNFDAGALEEPLRSQWQTPWQLLVVRLETSHTWLLTLVEPPNLTQSFQHRSPTYVWRENAPLLEATPEHLYALITESMAALLGVPAHSELKQLYEDSVRVSRLFQTHAPLTKGRQDDHPPAAWDVFLRSEQGLIHGHRFHPSPKSRRGFSDEDVMRYSPEMGARHPLHHFAVRSELVSGGSTHDKSFGDILNGLPFQAKAAPPGFIRLPVHPWQAKHLRGMPQVSEAMRAGTVMDLGEGKDWVYPTSSVRTVFHPELPYFLKLSLNVRITNCLRRQHPRELAAAMHVSNIWREGASPHPTFTVLQEPVYASAHLGNHAEVAEAFSLILRENPWGQPNVAHVPVVAATLFGPNDAWRKDLQPPNAVTWLQTYAQSLVTPLLHAFFERGVMFEAHLQNVLVAHAQGKPKRIFLRDLDNAKLIFDIAPASAFDGLSEECKDEVGYSLQEAWPRFVYCLFVNHLAEAIAVTVGGRRDDELAVWSAIRQTLQDYLRHTHVPAAALCLEPLLAGEDFPAKTNLLTRYFKSKDRHAGYRPVPNPLRHLA